MNRCLQKIKNIIFKDACYDFKSNPEPGRTVYVHVVSGVISVNGERLNEGDAAEVKESDVVDFAGIDHTEALVFDLP